MTTDETKAEIGGQAMKQTKPKRKRVTDTERMNWLTKRTGSDIVQNTVYTRGHVSIARSAILDEGFLGRTPRAAIDAAIRAEKARKL